MTLETAAKTCVLVCRLHSLNAKPIKQPCFLKTPNQKNSPLAEVVVCDSTSSDDENLPCYFPNYSLKENGSTQHSPSSSPASLSDVDKEEAIDHCSVLPIVENSELRHSSACTNNTLTSSILLHSMRRKLFDEGQCYVMDAKLQGNIGRFLNVCDMYVFQIVL